MADCVFVYLSESKLKKEVFLDFSSLSGGGWGGGGGGGGGMGGGGGTFHSTERQAGTASYRRGGKKAENQPIKTSTTVDQPLSRLDWRTAVSLQSQGQVSRNRH